MLGVIKCCVFILTLYSSSYDEKLIPTIFVLPAAAFNVRRHALLNMLSGSCLFSLGFNHSWYNYIAMEIN